MAFEAKFDHGEYLTTKYTPNADVGAGVVVVVGTQPRVTHRDIPANTLGTLAVRGGAYKLAKASAGAINDGDAVYWDDTNNVATKTTTNNTKFGTCIEAAADGDTIVVVEHNPA